MSSNYEIELLADGSGEILLATVDENVADGQVCSYSALVANSPHVKLADRSIVTRTPAQVIALGDYASGQKGEFLRRGFVRKSQFNAYAYSTPLYLSTVPGALTSTPPTTGILQQVAVALSGGWIDFEPHMLVDCSWWTPV